MSNFTDKRFSFATFMVIYLFQVAGIGFFTGYRVDHSISILLLSTP